MVGKKRPKKGERQRKTKGISVCMNSMTLEEIKFIENHLTCMVMLADGDDDWKESQYHQLPLPNATTPAISVSRHRNCRRLQSTTMFVRRRKTSIRRSFALILSMRQHFLQLFGGRSRLFLFFAPCSNRDKMTSGSNSKTNCFTSKTSHSRSVKRVRPWRSTIVSQLPTDSDHWHCSTD